MSCFLAAIQNAVCENRDRLSRSSKRQPLSRLLPDLGYFRDCVRTVPGDRARQAATQRAWRFNR